MRYLVDESTWDLSTVQGEERAQILEDFLELLEWIRDPVRGLTNGMENPAMPILRSKEIYDVLVEPGCTLCDFLFGPRGPEWRDLTVRIATQLSRMSEWEDVRPCKVLDVEVTGQKILAPTVGLAWTCHGERKSVACLALSHAGRRGALPIVVDDICRHVCFVAKTVDFRVFFRALIEIEKVDHQAFPDFAIAAFPDLEWVEGVWQGLRTKKSSFFGERLPVLVQHLSVLNDFGAQTFHACPGGMGVEQRLTGFNLSSENGRARSYRPSIKARTVEHRGTTHVFWWHTKITYDDGRIHFLHFPARPHSSDLSREHQDPPEGKIVIGIFNDHCVLP